MLFYMSFNIIRPQTGTLRGNTRQQTELYKYIWASVKRSGCILSEGIRCLWLHSVTAAGYSWSLRSCLMYRIEEQRKLTANKMLRTAFEYYFKTKWNKLRLYRQFKGWRKTKRGSTRAKRTRTCGKCDRLYLLNSQTPILGRNISLLLHTEALRAFTHLMCNKKKDTKKQSVQIKSLHAGREHRATET